MFHPAVIIHGAADAHAALAPGLPVTLLSAPGAAGFAGCLWWRELIAAARAEYPVADVTDILDCADAPGRALSAIRSGVVRLVLWADTPGWQSVAELAAGQGGFVLPQAIHALDLAILDLAERHGAGRNGAGRNGAERHAHRQLRAWLTGT